MWALAFFFCLAAADEAISPIGKVVSLLESMSEKLEVDQKSDKEMKEKLDCWCKQNSEEKLQAAASAAEKLQDLTALVEQLGPKIDDLGTQIRQANQDLAKGKATLKTAAAIRSEQMRAFKEDEKALMGSIDSVAKATKALNASASEEMQKVYALVQSPDLPQVALDLQRVLEGPGAMAYSKMSSGEKMMLNDFIQRPQHFLKAPSFLQRSDPTSSSIVGILKAMADDFAEDLQKELDDEKKNKKSYDDLSLAKSGEVKALEEKIMMKSQEKAEYESTLEVSKEDMKTTKKSRAADLDFQAAVEKHCTGGEEKYQERSRTRQAELKAVNDALEIFRSDASRDLLRGVSFMQVSSESEKKVNDFLVKEGKKIGAQALVSLGLRRLDFTKVTKQIKEMTVVLTQQKADEAEHRDMCVENLNENAVTSEEKVGVQNRTEDKIEMLKAKINKGQKEVLSLRAEVVEMEKQIQIAGDTRQKENVKFQTEAKEQQETQVILRKAVNILRSFYSSSVSAEKTSMVEIQEHRQGAKEQVALGQPEGFKDYEKNAGGQGVIGLIQTIMEDAKKLESEAIKDEQDAQAAYEDFVAETSKNIRAKQAEVDGEMKQVADASNDKAESESNLESTQQELDELSEAKMALHKECDAFMSNFEVRQKALDTEIEALNTAHALLS